MTTAGKAMVVDRCEEIIGIARTRLLTGRMEHRGECGCQGNIYVGIDAPAIILIPL